MTVVGDSLLEPFWPEGTGCARGFLSAIDAAWMFRRWANGKLNPLEIICERENIYKYEIPIFERGHPLNVSDVFDR